MDTILRQSPINLEPTTMEGYVHNSYERVKPEYYDLDPQEYLKRDVGFYLDYVKKTKGKILELGYGTGRITFEVAKLGYEIFGIDISESMNRLYTEKHELLPEDVRSRIRTFKADMADFSFDERFDLIIIPFRSFACLLSPEDMLNCLICIREHLSENGICIISLSYARNPLTERWIQNEEVFNWETAIEEGVLLRRYSRRKAVELENKTLHIDLIYRKFNNCTLTEETTENIRISYITQDEFECLADKAGLVIKNEFGGFDFCEIDGKNKEMIFVCGRK